jgi:hypothetical protein
MRNLNRNSLRACAALAMLVTTTTPATADLVPWDQAKVTAIASELPAATRALRVSLRQQPPTNFSQTSRRAFWRLRDQLRSIEASASRLHGALAEGEGHEQTFPTYRRMIVLVRDAAREVERIPTVKPVDQNIQVVADILKRLRPFYETDPIL